MVVAYIPEYDAVPGEQGLPVVHVVALGLHGVEGLVEADGTHFVGELVAPDVAELPEYVLPRVDGLQHRRQIVPQPDRHDRDEGLSRQLHERAAALPELQMRAGEELGSARGLPL